MIIGECYANSYVAKELAENFIKILNKTCKPKHRPDYGRDKIIKKIDELLQMNNTVVICVIDYEEGVSRKFIEKYFNLLEIDDSVFIGTRHKGKSKAIALIFDPNIEKAFICKIEKAICSDLNKMRKLKSPKALELLNNILNNDECKNKIQKWSQKLIETLRADF